MGLFFIYMLRNYNAWQWRKTKTIFFFFFFFIFFWFQSILLISSPINCETKSTFPKSYFLCSQNIFFLFSSLLSKLILKKHFTLKLFMFLSHFIKYIFLQIFIMIFFPKKAKKNILVLLSLLLQQERLSLSI